MTKQQENRAFVKMLKEFPKAFGRVSFRERLMLRTAFTYVSEEVIADIKANCDLAIEGRDVKIMELEKENTDLRDNYDQFKASAIPEIERLQKENKELKEQIEKMKTIIKKKCCKKCLYRKDNEMFLKLAYDENKKLEKQIEKMKCCDNCCHCGTNYDCDYCSDHFEEMPDWKLKE